MTNTKDNNSVMTIVCNDPSGLCLGGEAPPDSGVYTNLIQLAAQLSKQEETEQQQMPPRITIESESATIFVKSYDGHAVAVRLPTAAATAVQTDPPDTQSSLDEAQV